MNYITLKVQELKQGLSSGGASRVFVGKISFLDLENICRLTSREGNDGDSQFYQRHLSDVKTKKIAGFVSKTIIGDKGEIKNRGVMFPTAMILALNLSVGDDDTDDINFAKLKGDNEIDVPVDGDKLLIVDGQHRFMGVKRFFDANQDYRSTTTVEFPVTILANYDLYQQAMVFANVNFEQKPVNKSLYYDIFGTLPGDKGDISFAHYLVAYLNKDKEGPLYGMVKMLGVGPGIVSQSLLVETLLLTFKSGGGFVDLYNDYLSNGKKYWDGVKILTDYFSAIKEVFSSHWPVMSGAQYKPSGYKSILCKSTGMRALIKLLNRLLVLEDSKLGINKTYFSNKFKVIDAAKADAFFGHDGIYASGGGFGSSDKLFRALCEVLGLELPPKQ